MKLYWRRGSPVIGFILLLAEPSTRNLRLPKFPMSMISSQIKAEGFPPTDRTVEEGLKADLTFNLGTLESYYYQQREAILFVAVHITFGRAFNLSAFAYAETWDLFDLLAEKVNSMRQGEDI
ncbi:hypothetical protein V6N11_071382 [Hibiscus sabdariffa]|uniref:Uncharacterized protein n=1 Tax=Hibiscus sabdariffa TaxID=183260 RepID=A0ABR2TZX0_9ROSI